MVCSSLAMESVREALAAAQEAGDGSCLAHAAAWGALAGGRARRAALLLRVPRAPRPAAAAAQLMAQHAAVNSAKPADVFQVSPARGGVKINSHSVCLSAGISKFVNCIYFTISTTIKKLLRVLYIIADNNQRRFYQLPARHDRSDYGRAC